MAVGKFLTSSNLLLSLKFYDAGSFANLKADSAILEPQTSALSKVPPLIKPRCRRSQFGGLNQSSSWGDFLSEGMGGFYTFRLKRATSCATGCQLERSKSMP